MELTTAVKERRSVRKYEDRLVEHELIEEIIEAARYCPSWKNTQIAGYILVENPELKNEIASGRYSFGFTYNRKALMNAPQIMILTYEKGISGFEKDGSFSTPKGEFWEAFDCGAAAQTFCLLAHERGVGTVIQGYYDDGKLAGLLGLPKNIGIGAVIPLGYIGEKNTAPRRKDVSELISYR